MRSMMTSLQKWIIPLLGLLLVGPAAIAGTDDVAQGQALYLRYCASCHGPDGAGHGPVASTLSTPPANLRLLAERYGNPLPEDQIARFIDGRADVKAHGQRDMPVWGDRVWENPEGKGCESQVKNRVAKLVAYLQSIQAGGQHASLSSPW